MRSNYQKVVQKQNQNKIIQLLNEQPLTFKQIIEKSSLSRSVVNEHLKALEEQGLIKKEYKNTKLLNVLTRKGEKSLAPFVFAIKSQHYAEGLILENEKAEKIKTQGEEEGILIPVTDLFKGLKPEERMQIMARRFFVRGLFGFLITLRTGERSWVDEVAGSFPISAEFMVQLGLCPDALKETIIKDKHVQVQGESILHIIGEYGGESIAKNVKETFKLSPKTINQFILTLTKTFPKEMEELTKIYEKVIA